MNGPWMWIVLGVLIAIVVGFLIISAVLDKKKRKKRKEEENRLDTIRKEAKGRVAILVNLLVAKNQEKLDKFIPSIGELKMSDINNLAKDEIAKVQKTEGFLMLKNEDEEFINQFFIISKEKSNNWTKKNQEQIQYFQKIEDNLDKDIYKNYIKNTKIRLTRKYK